MLDLAGGTTVYLACGVTDLRKSYNGLAAIIKLKVSAKYCYATHELRLHQNDRCKRFTLV